MWILNVLLIFNFIFSIFQIFDDILRLCNGFRSINFIDLIFWSFSLSLALNVQYYDSNSNNILWVFMLCRYKTSKNILIIKFVSLYIVSKHPNFYFFIFLGAHHHVWNQLIIGSKFQFFHSIRRIKFQCLAITCQIAMGIYGVGGNFDASECTWVCVRANNDFLF